MITPGTNYPGAKPIDDAHKDLASAALEVFLAAVRDRTAELEQVPIRAPGGRHRWRPGPRDRG